MYEYDLRILDESESVLYEYPGMGSDIMRGLAQEEHRLWICAERWTSHHHKGYVEGWLKESDVFLIDLRDGEILFQDKAGEAVLDVEDTCPKRGDLLPGHVRLGGGTHGLHL